MTKGIIFRNDFAQTTSFNLEWNIVHAEGSLWAVIDVTALGDVEISTTFCSCFDTLLRRGNSLLACEHLSLSLQHLLLL